MRAPAALAVLLLAGSSFAQMTRAQAEEYMRAMNSLPRGGEELTLWRLTAPDADLIQVLRTGSGERAVAAIYETGRRRRPQLISAIESSFMRGDSQFAIAAVELFAKIGGRQGMQVVQRATRHREPEPRWEAARISAGWGFRGARPPLREAVQNRVHEAVVPLSLVGNSADIPLIRAYWKQFPTPQRKRPVDLRTTDILVALTRLGDRGALVTARDEIRRPSDRWFRSAILPALASRRDARDIPLFMQALQDPEMRVRFAAAEALGLLQAEKAIAALRKMAQTPGPDAKNAGTNERLGRQYADYVADCLQQDRKPLTLKMWRAKPRSTRA